MKSRRRFEEQPARLLTSFSTYHKTMADDDASRRAMSHHMTGSKIMTGDVRPPTNGDKADCVLVGLSVFKRGPSCRSGS
jgi:hypothetical protein